MSSSSTTTVLTTQEQMELVEDMMKQQKQNNREQEEKKRKLQEQEAQFPKEKTSVKEILLGSAAGMLFWEGLIVRLIMPRVAKWATKQTWFETIKNRSGAFCQNAQDDFTHLIMVGIHHCLAGLILKWGNENNNRLACVLASLLEVSFEVSDVIRMAFSLYPYQQGKVEASMKLAMIAHHMPGLLAMIPMLRRGEYGTSSMRNVASWLLFAGGASGLSGSFVHTCNLENPAEARQASLVHGIGASLFAYVRFYLYPMQVKTLFEDDILPRFGAHSKEAYLGTFVSAALMVFNVLVFKKNFTKGLKYLAKGIFPNAQIDFDDLKQ